MRRADPLKLDLVRSDILRAAMTVFQKYGLDKATMEDIAETAGKGKSTLYYYFKRKEDVFSAVAEQEMRSMLNTLEQELKKGRTAGDKVRLFFTVQDKTLRNTFKLYPTIFKETTKHIQLFHGLQRFANTLRVKLFKSILLEGIDNGEFGSISRKDCDTLAVATVATLHAMQLNIMLDGDEPTAEAKLKVMHDIVVRGLK